MNKTKKHDVLFRFNTRITKAQKKFIKEKVKQSKVPITEGGLLRTIINFYIKHSK